MFPLRLAPVDNRRPEASPAWRRLLTPMAFFRDVSREGQSAWIHNVACRDLLFQASLVRSMGVLPCFWIAAAIAEVSPLVSVPFWMGLIVLAVQALLYGVCWIFLGRRDTE